MIAGQDDLPLSGTRILELSAVGPVPFATRMLALLGAEVTVIAPPEPRDVGLPLRDDPLERGKRRAAIDLREDAGRRELLARVTRADALVEGFRPGTIERLGLAPDALWSANPALVIGRCGGWGGASPRGRTAGHDINFLALSGLLSATGPAERPLPPVNLVGDFGGGAMHLALGLAAALPRARKTGRGMVVETSIFEATASLCRHLYGLRDAGLWPAGREENLLDGGAPYYRCYATRDGGWVAVGAIEPRFFAILVERTGAAIAPADQNDRTRWPGIAAALAARFATRTRDAWDALFADCDGCVTPIVSLDEARGRPDAAFAFEGGDPRAGLRFSARPEAA